MAKTIDPALADDLPSVTIAGAFYDTLVQYKYGTEDQSLIEPAMLVALPVVSEDGKTFTCTLRDDLYFQSPENSENTPPLKVTSRDVVFSLCRLADSRLHSPGYDFFRDSIIGFSDFYERSKKAAANDFSIYDQPPAGLEIVNDKQFIIRCNENNPRFLYLLAMTFCSVVSRSALEYRNTLEIMNEPCGSGPFLMADWKKDYSISMKRNHLYREEYYDGKRLPVADRITCYLGRQNVSSFLLFLQGNLDYYALNNDQVQTLINEKNQLSPALANRGIRLVQVPQLETNYIGFYMNDPVIGSNLRLRKAVSYAFDKNLRVSHSGGRLQPAFGPVPPGLSGHVASGISLDLEKARQMLAEAGYPNGMDPETGKRLTLSFDQAGSDIVFQQIGEMMKEDMKKIGINVEVSLNTRPRFQEKLKTGNIQLFRYSWVADYPDAENFLKLFYSHNAGGCNRACFSDPVYDRMYEEILYMQDTPERTEKYKAMVAYLAKQTPWIYESHPLSFVLCHSWLKNYSFHNFSRNQWKYLSADSKERAQTRSKFTPLKMSELR